MSVQKYTLSLVFIFFVNAVMAQGLSGSNAVYVGQESTYTFTDGAFYVDYYWNPVNGYVVSETQSGINYSVTIYWSTLGTGSLSFIDGGNIVAFMNVTITDNRAPIPVTTFSVVNNCGNTVITRNTNPPAGVTWFWQTSAYGVSESIGSSSQLTLPEGSFEGMYYLRAKKIVYPVESDPWSDGGQLVGNITINSVPSSPTGANNASRNGTGNITISTAPVASASAYRWYFSSAGGTYDIDQVGSSYTFTNLSITTTRYVSTRDGNCESPSRLAVTAYILPDPLISFPNGNFTNVGSPVTLTTQTFSTYLWRYEDGTTLGTTQSVQVNKPGYYTVEVTDSRGTGISPSAKVDDIIESQNLSFVVTNEINTTGIKKYSDVYGLTADNRQQSIEYFDGIGRAMQSVAVQASPSKNDIVGTAKYDALGRESERYAPIVSPQNTGLYQLGILGTSTYNGSPHYNFYNSTNTENANVSRDSHPFSKTIFEASPLNRPLKQGALGYQWNPDFGDNHITNKYRTNTVDDSVRKWSNSSIVSTATYNAAELRVEDVEDEEKLKSHVFYTKEGLKVLERIKSESGNTVSETYYIYDIYNNLKVLITPAHAELMKTANNYAPTPTDLDNWSYQSQYDELHRVIVQKSPGAQPNYIVYDKRNRTILTQDGNQRLRNEWSYTKYDEFDRIVFTGIHTTPATHTELINYVNQLDGGKGYQNVSAPTYSANQVRTGATISSSAFDGYKEYHATQTITLQPGFSFSASAANTFRASIGSSFSIGTTVFPSENVEDHSITYYDRYDYNDLFTNHSLQFAIETWQTTNIEPFAKQLQPMGSVTANSIRILGTNQWLNAIIYYDKEGRTIQSIGYNHLGSVDKISTAYNFRGDVVESKNITNGILSTRRFMYDHTGRITKLYHKLNTQPEVLLESYVYNELGQLIDKKLHSTDNGANHLQSIDYTYNIRGWLSSINNFSGGESNDYFTMENVYEQTFPSQITSFPKHDGLITATKWKNDLSNNAKYYAFTYSAQKWLTDAIYSEKLSGLPATGLDKFSEKGLSYDQNGNIKTLQRYMDNGTTQIDLLGYNYSSTGGNQLLSVTDTAPVATKDKGFKDGNTVGNDYTYDVNGNLTANKNKGITNIQYNIINLPQQVTFADASYLTYQYTASGDKLSQKYFNSAGQEILKTDYLSNQVYVNDELSLQFTESGRLVPPSFQNLFRNKEANSTEGFNPLLVTLTSEFSNGQTYVKATHSPTSYAQPDGIVNIDQSFAVIAGETYRFKVKGYNTNSNPVYLRVQDQNNNNVVWQTVALPVGPTNEAWVTADFVVPVGVSYLSCSIMWNSAGTGDAFFVERIALYKTDWEYQYFLTDQVGSPRIVLGTEKTTVTSTATFETEAAGTENTQFMNINYSHVVPHITANATGGGNEVIRLNNTYRVGPARSMKVFPGDIITAQVSAYYEAGSGFSQAPISTIIASVANVLAGGAPAAFEGIANAYNTSNAGNTNLLLAPAQGSTKPSAFLNYILFDENYLVLQAKSVAVGSANIRHILSMPFVNVSQAGYLFIYLSYDNDNTNWVHFDELKITHYESPVLQVNNYYPFGMAATTWVRDGETENKYEYQGKEYDSLTQWHDFHARQYDASLGRWFAQDPAKQFASQYLAMGNSPINGIDPDGEFFGTMITAVVDAFKTIFNGGLDITCGSCMRNAWSDFDPTKQGTKTNNAWRIDKGIFQTDKDKCFIGQFWQLTKRLTWQLPNTILGNLASHKYNLFDNVEGIDYFHGSTVVYREGQSNGAFSVGGYINMTTEDSGGNPYNTVYGNVLLIHEYGHYLQEQALGPITIFSGINSVLSSRPDWRSTRTHKEIWVEGDANARALHYFRKKDAFNNWRTLSGTTSAETRFRRRYTNIQWGNWRWSLYLISPPVAIGYYIHNSNPK